MRRAGRLSPGRLVALDEMRYGPVGLTGLGIVALLAIVVTGHSDLVATV
jgi:hypothetical protein